MNRPDKNTAIERLKKALDPIPELKSRSDDSPDFMKWKRDTQVALLNTFGSDSHNLEEFNEIVYNQSFFPSDDLSLKDYKRGLDRASSMLESMIDEVKDYWADEDLEDPHSEACNDGIESRDVFVVHGRDGEAKATVARLLEVLQMQPVILHEQASQGNTIIEKFESHAHPAFAVALLTPDDVGALAEDQINLRSRARQNVIFEFGYLIGKIGRERVCAITRGELEVPSDYDGVVYIPMDDAGAWKMSLVKELRAAGLDVDANLML